MLQDCLGMVANMSSAHKSYLASMVRYQLVEQHSEIYVVLKSLKANQTYCKMAYNIGETICGGSASVGACFIHLSLPEFAHLFILQDHNDDRSLNPRLSR